MDDRHNILLGTALPKPRKTHPLARVSAGTALMTIAAIFLGNLWAPLAYLQPVFPLAIVTGHMALRRMDKEPGRWAGKSIALFGLYVGYFNLAMMGVLLYRMYRPVS